ncbi:uncharacterized protein LOC114248827 [Bombyx mandarina]|uniref:Uncharacterized protein LOC114248827 n=1 Tax=Bombyx mandarina TaxID=7092 RepID=A0A6J2K7T4_BOMMA|nr:uncharacterized protein LOC114248827 [Bombyx mandarina]
MWNWHVKVRKLNDLQGVILLVFATLPLIASTNIDCLGKAFHCVNSTHFMICVDIGAGFSSTIDDFVIPCPPTTVCQQNNRFECEFPPITTPAPTLPTVSYVKESIQWLDPTNPTHENIIRSTQLDTTINEAYNTISTTTLANLENDNEITTRALEKYPLGSSATKDFFWNTSPTLDETTSHYKEKRESVSTTTEAISEKSTLSVQKETTDDSFIATTSLQNENIPVFPNNREKYKIIDKSGV